MSVKIYTVTEILLLMCLFAVFGNYFGSDFMATVTAVLQVR